MSTGNYNAMDTKRPALPERINSFQGLRGYAIFLVFISHCKFAKNAYDINVTSWLGGIGVSLFIMLSGYLTMMGHREDSELLPLGTLKKRLKRFYPLHIATLIAAVPLCLGLFIKGDKLKELVKLILNAALLQAWVPSNLVYYSYNMESWYLSATVFFILIGTVTAKAVKGMRGKALPAVYLLLMIFEFAWGSAMKDKPGSHWFIYILPLVRCTDFVCGGMICAAVTAHREKLRKYSAVIFAVSAAAAAVLAVISFGTDNKLFLTAVWFVPASLLIASAAGGDGASGLTEKVFCFKPAVLLGNISFEFFLIHHLVMRYLTIISGKLLGYEGALIYIPVFLLTIAAVQVWRLIMKKIFQGGNKSK